MVLACVSATPLVEVAAGMWLSSSGWSRRIRSFCEIGWWSEWTGFVEQNRRKRDEVGIKLLLLWSAWSAIVASLSTYIIRLRMGAESESEMVVDNDVDVLSVLFSENATAHSLAVRGNTDFIRPAPWPSSGRRYAELVTHRHKLHEFCCLL